MEAKDVLLVQHSVNPTIRNEMKGKSRSSRTKPLYLALLVLDNGGMAAKRQLVLLHHAITPVMESMS
jgi:hypothetical protein